MHEVHVDARLKRAHCLVVVGVEFYPQTQTAYDETKKECNDEALAQTFCTQGVLVFLPALITGRVLVLFVSPLLFMKSATSDRVRGMK